MTRAPSAVRVGADMNRDSHSQNANSGAHPGAEERKRRLGHWLFAAYLLLYGGFVGLCAFAPGATSMHVLPGVNLAILYGMGLIIAAVILALVYARMRRTRRGEKRIDGGSPGDGA